jgi:hypothetical protein
MSIPMQPLSAAYNPDLAAWFINRPDVITMWQPLDQLRQPGFYIENYFDTSGYTNDKLTVFTENAFIQEAGRYQHSFPGNARWLVVDLIMTERIDDVTEMAAELVDSNTLIPGTSNSTDDWNQVIFGRLREFTGITQANAVQDVFAPVSDQQWGSLEPTTADKLWTYKILLITGIPDTLSQIKYPASRVVMNTEVRREDDMAYMMRQKRSYELTSY